VLSTDLVAGTIQVPSALHTRGAVVPLASDATATVGACRGWLITGTQDETSVIRFLDEQARWWIGAHRAE